MMYYKLRDLHSPQEALKNGWVLVVDQHDKILSERQLIAKQTKVDLQFIAEGYRNHT